MTTRMSILSGIAASSLAAAMFAAHSPSLFADGLKCDLTQYKASHGSHGGDRAGSARCHVGRPGRQRTARALRRRQGQPVVRDLAVRKQGGQWATLGQNLIPDTTS